MCSSHTFTHMNLASCTYHILIHTYTHILTTLIFKLSWYKSFRRSRFIVASSNTNRFFAVSHSISQWCRLLRQKRKEICERAWCHRYVLLVYIYVCMCGVSNASVPRNTKYFFFLFFGREYCVFFQTCLRCEWMAVFWFKMIFCFWFL